MVGLHMDCHRDLTQFATLGLKEVSPLEVVVQW